MVMAVIGHRQGSEGDRHHPIILECLPLIITIASCSHAYAPCLVYCACGRSLENGCMCECVYGCVDACDACDACDAWVACMAHDAGNRGRLMITSSTIGCYGIY